MASTAPPELAPAGRESTATEHERGARPVSAPAPPSPPARDGEQSEVATPLELGGWLAFNTWRTGLRAHRVERTDGGARLRAVLYLDRRGHVRFPPGNAYLPVVFSSGRQRQSGQTAEWLRTSGELADEMKQRGVVNTIQLPPEIDDVRPWQWRGFLLGLRYTYVIDFPLDPSLADREARRQADKAAELGMTVELVDDPDVVVACLAEAEARKDFSHGITSRELRVLQGLLGPESLRLYVCRDATGRAAAARVLLHAAGTHAIAWMAATRSADLRTGANSLLWRHVLDDVAAAGATGVDLNGANLEPVAMFKSHWGGRLVPTYTLRSHSLRAAARFLLGWRAALGAGRSLPSPDTGATRSAGRTRG